MIAALFLTWSLLAFSVGVLIGKAIHAADVADTKRRPEPEPFDYSFDPLDAWPCAWSDSEWQRRWDVSA